MKRLIILIIGLASLQSFGQQFSTYSQFMMNKSLISPSFTGWDSELLEVGINNRWQYNGVEGAPRAMAITAHTRLKNKRVGLGINFNKESEAVSDYNYFQLNYAYHLPISARQHISLGLSGIASNFNSDDQRVSTIVNDNKFSTRLSEWNANFGLGISYRFNDLWASVSVPLLLSNNFGEEASNLYEQSRHLFLSGGYVWKISSELSIEPNVLVKAVAGSPVSYDINALGRFYNIVGFGLGYRRNESMALLLQLSPFEGLNFGYSYDVITGSTLKALSNNSQEILITYKIRNRKENKRPEAIVAKAVQDSDLDGIPDDRDGCPKEPGLAINFGCPLADTDSDGIPDKSDMCPNVVGIVSLGGCPDSDGDGVKDSEDKCPNLAGVANLNGCPDMDGDLVPDYLDTCPTEAGLVSANGCPDSDGDGIIDAADNCPNEAGTAELNGCPELDEEVQQVLTSAVAEVQFEAGSARLKAQSKQSLDNLTELLKENSAYQLKVTGYTDSYGDENKNLALSIARAEAVKNYLMSKGIPADRVEANGLGEANPIADNSTAEGRRLNRRVEFEIQR